MVNDRPCCAFARRNRQRSPYSSCAVIFMRVSPLDASKGKEGVSVDLVSVIHVGDREFYQGLNKRFEGYDVVLFEGVKGQPKSKLLLVVAAALAPLIDHDSSAKQMQLDSQSQYV